MKRKLARILGISGGALSVLPWLVFIGGCIWTLSLPDNEVHFESKGYASGFLIIFLILLLVSAAGLTGGLLVHKKRKLGVVLMIVSGGILLFIQVPLKTEWWLMIGPPLLVAAGIIAFNIDPAEEPPPDEKPDMPS